MTNFRFCFVAVVAALFVVPSISHAQTYYTDSMGMPIISAPMNSAFHSPVYGVPVTGEPVSMPYVSSPAASTTWVNSTPVVSRFPVSSPVYSTQVVSPATTSWQGYSYPATPLYVSPGADHRVQRYYSSRPAEYYDGQTLYLTGPRGFTSQRRTHLGQSYYYSNQMDRLERAYTGETSTQQDERRYREANRAWQARTRQALPNNPVLRLGANIFLGPSKPASMQRNR